MGNSQRERSPCSSPISRDRRACSSDLVNATLMCWKRADIFCAPHSISITDTRSIRRAMPSSWLLREPPMPSLQR